MSSTANTSNLTMVNAFDPEKASGLDPKTQEMVRRREKLLGPAYRLFYQQPVQVVRGSGTRLWNPDGEEYLDAYNNVVPAGHANSRVTAAVHQQMQTLSTHTRYLQDGILDYAEDLLGTMGPLGDTGHVMFTCTGSEANDLALRIAKHHTGHEGIIVTSEAYHGNSELTSGCSPALGSRARLGTWVRQVPAPDSYRIPREQLADLLVEHVREQIADLQRRGQGLAAFIADSVFSSDGIFGEPTDLLAPVAKVVRDAGGLFIADEVQSGFARTGDSFWGYQRHGVQPDIVTMGKPMGNGYPVAGLVARPGVVERFGNDQRYFNTFGGNTVAIAAAQATLDVLRDDDLLTNARTIGQVLRDGIAELSLRYECLGDIRGAGLYVGVEVVSDRDGKVPDQARASAIVNAMRDRRVLISSTGPSANVLKIRPPLVFSSDDADWLLSTLADVMSTTDEG
ncbi:aspartate aminotransferase family protein [Saxibacter everestensis]|uniref:Aspartate aminotransferase family protein n=1 Tax=Saxibacter everestensis TaxID=2909229 RepID=A0ABY8QQX0_9MICO|nr:aspartate aminotransferase family protein [Brevibacteriaceae bacterium ZFBP1038]